MQNRVRALAVFNALWHLATIECGFMGEPVAVMKGIEHAIGVITGVGDVVEVSCLRCTCFHTGSDRLGWLSKPVGRKAHHIVIGVGQCADVA